MEKPAMARSKRQVKDGEWRAPQADPTNSSGYVDEREVSEERSEKKRGREWLVEREYISRRLVDTMSSKQDEQQQQQDRQENPFASVFPPVSFLASPEPVGEGPAKSWSSEDTADFSNFESQSARSVPCKRFRKYCAKNPYAAQAAAASLLAGAAWLEAVQALAAVKSEAAEGMGVRMQKVEAVNTR